MTRLEVLESIENATTAVGLDVLRGEIGSARVLAGSIAMTRDGILNDAEQTAYVESMFDPDSEQEKRPAALTAGQTIEVSEKETINMATVAVPESTHTIPAGLEGWSDASSDGSYVHRVGGTAEAEFQRGGFASVQLAYSPDDYPAGDGFMVNVELPASPGGYGGESFNITAGETRSLVNGLLAVLALVPDRASAPEPITPVHLRSAEVRAMLELVTVPQLGLAARQLGIKASEMLASINYVDALLDSLATAGFPNDDA